MSKPAELSVEELALAEAPKILVEPPGPEAKKIIERDNRVVSPALPRAYPFAPKRGSGSVLEDVDGNLFLDMNAGIAVNATGHSHPKVVEAIQKQAAELIHYSGSDFFLPIYSETAQRLSEIAPITKPTRVTLQNSGAEAVEASIKLARWVTQRPNIIAFYGAFHGRTLGSVSVTASKTKYRARFGPLGSGVFHAPYGSGQGWGLDLSDPEGCEFPTIAYIEKILFKRVVSPDEVAAILVEPVQGEGGYLVPPDGWLAALRELCDRHGILMIADEVQSGIGRTGKMWAIQHFDVEPDIVLSAKGLASGMPLGAVIARADLMLWDKGVHGSTYGGSPTCCAAALATIDLVENGLKQNAAEIGPFFMDGLRKALAPYPWISEVRGLGLMIGVAFSDHDKRDAVEQACFKRGLLALGCGDDAIRMSPPLLLRRDQAEKAIEVFADACAAVG